MLTSNRPVIFVAFAITSAILLAGGCSRQKEGERCVVANGDSDCEGDLVCTSASKLRGGEDEVDRCCPADGAPSSSESCALKTTVGPGTGGTGNGGESNVGGEDSGDGDDLGDFGSGCAWTSDCQVGYVCGPGGTCQKECNSDRDCDAGEACSADQECVAAK